MATKVPAFKLYPGEFGYIALMLVVSGYMWYGSYEYAALAGFFPRMMSIIVFALSLVLLIRRLSFVPERVRNVVEGGTGTFVDESSMIDETETDDEEETVERVERNQMGRNAAVVGLLTGAYMLFGFLFGLLWGTPLYIIAYLQYADYSWGRTLAIAAVVTAIIYAMMDIFNFSLATGAALKAFGIQSSLDVALKSTLMHASVGGII